MVQQIDAQKLVPKYVASAEQFLQSFSHLDGSDYSRGKRRIPKFYLHAFLLVGRIQLPQSLHVDPPFLSNK
jgi:hypothetical protein